MALTSTAQIAQNMVTNIACRNLGFKELDLYFYNSSKEAIATQNSRFDGIFSEVAHNDIIVFQSPTWNGVNWDISFFNKVYSYRNIKKIIFIEDVEPLMFENDRYLLQKWINNYYNKADALICPTKKMFDFLKTQGLKNKKIVFQKMWDHPCNMENVPMSTKRNAINFVGNPNRFTFVHNWNYNNIPLHIYASSENKNSVDVIYEGWKIDQELLLSLRKNGGFGLVWAEDPIGKKYGSLNIPYKLSTYLASGIPVIIHSSNASKELILDNHLGFVVDSLDEATEKITKLSQEGYSQMLTSVDSFARLIRNGYFTKRALIEAVFKVLSK
jgi:glycosyltransferase involved in cell wall biosynthesis